MCFNLEYYHFKLELKQGSFKKFLGIAEGESGLGILGVKSQSGLML